MDEDYVAEEEEESEEVEMEPEDEEQELPEPPMNDLVAIMANQARLLEALYGRKCRTLLMWSEVGERSYFGPECIQEAEEQVAKIRENLKAAQSRQKSYADTRR